MPQIDVCFASDERYAPYMGVALASIVAHAAPQDELHFHILENKISAENKQKLKRVCSTHLGTQLSFYSLVDFSLEQFKVVNSHLSPTAYGRLFVGRLLPKEVTRVIYLDCDVFVRGSLAPLATLPLPEPYVLGGVEDIGVMQKAFEGKHSWPYQTHCYINSGVLLIDLARWRSGQWEKKCLDYLARPAYPLQYEDQDVLNFVLKDVIKLIPHKWNGQMYWAFYYFRNYHAIGPLRKILQTCPIVHFCTPHKPWLGSSLNTNNQLYRKFMKQSLWKENMHCLTWKEQLKILLRYMFIHPNFLFTKKFYRLLYHSGICGLI